MFIAIRFGPQHHQHQLSLSANPSDACTLELQRNPRHLSRRQGAVPPTQPNSANSTSLHQRNQPHPNFTARLTCLRAAASSIDRARTRAVMTRIILIWQVLDCSRGLYGNRRHRPRQRQLRYSSQALGVHACGSGHLLRQQKTLARAAAPNILSTGLTAEVSLRCAACAAHLRDVAQTCCMCMATLMYHQY